MGGSGVLVCGARWAVCLAVTLPATRTTSPPSSRSSGLKRQSVGGVGDNVFFGRHTPFLGRREEKIKATYEGCRYDIFITLKSQIISNGGIHPTRRILLIDVEAKG